MRTTRAVVMAAALVMVAAVVFDLRADSAPASPSETNMQAAQAFLHMSYLQRDAAGAYRLYADPNFIQHDPTMGDGVAGWLSYFEHRAQDTGEPPQSSWADVTDRVIFDGDLVAAHHHMFRSPSDPGRYFFELWRFKDGKIVEHWDVIQNAPEQALNSMACGEGADYASAKRLGHNLDDPSCGRLNPKAERAASLQVVAAYTTALNEGHVREAAEKYLAPDFRQHSPHIPDGVQGLVEHLDKSMTDPKVSAPAHRLAYRRAERRGDLPPARDPR